MIRLSTHSWKHLWEACPLFNCVKYDEKWTYTITFPEMLAWQERDYINKKSLKVFHTGEMFLVRFIEILKSDKYCVFNLSVL